MRRPLQVARALVALGLWVAAMALARPALAGRMLRARLVAPASELPAFVCVVHNDRPAEGAAVLLARSRALPAGAADLGALRAGGDWAAADEQKRLEWQIAGDVAKLRPELAGKPAGEALAALADRQAVCDFGDCAPRFYVPLAKNEKWMTCGRNPRADRRRVLVLDLTFGTGGPVPLDVHVDGAVVEILLGKELDAASAPKLTVLGGHYVADGQGLGREDQTLDLRTVCQERELDLGGLRASAEDLVQVLDCPSDRSAPRVCGARGGSARVALREQPAGQARELRAISLRGTGALGDLRAACSGSPPDAVRGALSVRWFEGAVPPRLPDAVARVVSFSWSDPPPASDPGARGCHLPVDACPAASIEALGVVDCRGVRAAGARCDYRCVASTGGAAFPLAVRMTAGRQGDTWRETLSGNDDALRGHADRDDRQFGVFFDWAEPGGASPLAQTRAWQALRDGPFDAIDRVELRHPLWGTTTVSVDADQRVRLPGLTCGDKLFFRPRGYRAFDEEATVVRDGTVILHRPVSGRWWRFGIGASAGAMPEKGFDVVRPYALAEGQFRWEPERSRVGLEVSLQYLFAEQGFQPIDEARTLGRADGARLYNRVLPHVGVLYRPSHVWELHASAGPGFGWALLAADATAVGDLEAFLSLRAGGRYRILPHFALAGALRAFLWHPYFVHSLAPGGSAPLRSRTDLFTLGGELGFLVTP